MTENYYRRLKLIIFDWDGTLSDSAGHIVSSIQSACADLAYPIPNDQSIRQIVGLELNSAFAYLFKDVNVIDNEALAARYQHYFWKNADRLPLFCGADNFIKTLFHKHYYCVIATGKSRSGLNQALQISNLETYFYATRCADETFNKPHPAMLLELLDICQCKASQALMIGDTTYDLETADNANIASIAVTYGAHSEQTLKAFKGIKPLFFANSMAALANWFEENVTLAQE